MSKTESLDLHLFNISKDAGCDKDEIIVRIPKWNLELEERLRDKYFIPFLTAISTIENKDFFDWISSSFDFYKGKNIVSRRMVNKARVSFIESLADHLAKTGGKITPEDEKHLSTKMKIANLMELDIKKYNGDFKSVN